MEPRSERDRDSNQRDEQLSSPPERMRVSRSRTRSLRSNGNRGRESSEELERRSTRILRFSPSNLNGEHERHSGTRSLKRFHDLNEEHERRSSHGNWREVPGNSRRNDEQEQRSMIVPRSTNDDRDDVLEHESLILNYNLPKTTRRGDHRRYKRKLSQDHSSDDDRSRSRSIIHPLSPHGDRLSRSSVRRSPSNKRRRDWSRSPSSARPSTSRASKSGYESNSNINNSKDVVNQFVEALKQLSKSANHKLPSVGNVIPEFDPLSKAQTILNWITKVEECAEIYEWDEREIIHYALPKLSGLAKSWYQSLPTLLFTWSEWKSKLVEAFPCRENYAELLSEMLSLKVKYGDPLEQYYYAKLNLLNRCQIVGRKAVDCILYGIEDRAIRLGAQAAQFQTPEQVLKYLKMVKVGQVRDRDNIGISKNRTDSNKKGNLTVTSNKPNIVKAPIKCFNCGVEGHPSFKCPKPIEKCTNCYKLGHRTVVCPSMSNNKTQTNTSKDTISTEKQVLKLNVHCNDTVQCTPPNNNKLEVDNKYLVTAKVNDKSIPCFVDLGSECSIIRKSEASSLGLELTKNNLPFIRGIGSSIVRPIGKAVVNIEIQGIKETIEIFVVEDDILKYSLLLGHSFTERPDILITKTPKRLIFERTDKHSKIFLLVKDDVEIGVDEIKAVPIHTDSLSNGRIYVDGSIRGKPEHKYFLCPGEYELKNGHGNVLVQNLSGGSVKFPTDFLISRAVPIDMMPSVLNLDIESKQSFDTINCNNNLSNEQFNDLNKLLIEFADCFSSGLRDLGFTNAAEMEIKLNDSEPVVYRPYRMSHSERGLVREMVQEMLDANIVRESSSPYASPIVLVKKKTGEKRLCVDYRALNRKTIKDHYPLPLVEDQLDQLAGHTFFTSLDLASGYYQIPISEESQPKTAFVTPDGQFEYLRMPFGLVNAPSVFQRTINKILAEAKTKFAIVYMDDILIPAHNFAEGMERLREVLELLRRGGLTLKLSKCNFFFNHLDFLGFEVGPDGIRPGSRKTTAVANFPIPRNQHEVRQFMGLASFFRRFIKDFALIAKPLTDLLRKDSSWKWTSEQDNAFTSIKNKLLSRPIIALYDPSAETHLHTDACKNGVAGILLQKNKDGVLCPVSYYSRKTTIDEQKLHAFELETLAVIASLNRFRVYLLGIPFKIFTDCNALRTTLTKRDLVPRIARWWIQLQEFDCSIEYRPGDKMAHVDALSRNPVDPAVPESHVLDVLNIETDNWLSTAQMVDDEIVRIKKILNSPDAEKCLEVCKNFKLKNDRVYRIVDNGLRWVVPKAIRWQILKRNHDDIGHFGFEKTLSRIKDSYWFPKLRKFVKKYVSACLECAHHKHSGGPRQGELHPIPKIDRPFHTIHADHLGPFIRSKRGNCYLLVIVDGFTKFINIRPVRNTKALTTVRTIKEHISYFGAPSRLITDQGSCFTSHAFKKFINDSGIKHILNAVATPRANGQVERFNRTVLDALSTKTHGKDDRSWDEFVPDIQIGINTTIHKTTKKSPSELLFGFNITNPSESILSDVIDDTIDGTLPVDVTSMRKDACKRIQIQQDKDKEQFNKKRKVSMKYNEGDLVRIEREMSTNDGKSKKLIAKFQGPYRICKILPNDRFVVEDTPLTRKNNRRYEAIVAIDKMRPWMNLNVDLGDSNSSSDEDHNNDSSTQNQNLDSGDRSSLANNDD